MITAANPTPEAALKLPAAATGGIMVEVELPPGIIDGMLLPPVVAATVVRAGSVHEVTGTGDRVTISGVEGAGLQA